MVLASWLSFLQHKSSWFVTPRFKNESVLGRAHTCDDTVLQAKNLGLVVAGQLWVGVGHAGKERQVLWDVRLLHLLSQAVVDGRTLDSLNYKLILFS